MPNRIQLSRKKGWRKPENTVVVSRPTKWGNPFTWKYLVDVFGDKGARTDAVLQFALWLNGNGHRNYEQERRQWILTHFTELQDKNLACWCPPDMPCHADILIELANNAAPNKHLHRTAQPGILLE